MLSVLYEDDATWIYDKPSDVSVLRDRSGQACLWDELTSYATKPYLVHRLDKGTSGCFVIAKTQQAQSSLTRAFAARSLSKSYVAAVVGRFASGFTRTVDLPICRGRKSRYRIAGLRDSIECVNNTYRVQQDRDGLEATPLIRFLVSGPRSMLAIKPITGRTHQIRVHLSWIGHAIGGDHLYGNKNHEAQKGARLMLHCHKLVIPGFGRFTSPVPKDFATSFGQ